MPRPLAVIAVLVVLGVLSQAGLGRSSGSGEDAVVALLGTDAAASNGSALEAAGVRVAQVDDGAATGGAWVVVVDEAALARVDAGWLQSQVLAGKVVVGLGVPLTDLAAATGTAGYFGTEDRPARGASPGGQAGFSYIWRASAGRCGDEARGGVVAGLPPEEMGRWLDRRAAEARDAASGRC